MCSDRPPRARINAPTAIRESPRVGGVLQKREQHLRICFLPYHHTRVWARDLPARKLQRVRDQVAHKLPCGP